MLRSLSRAARPAAIALARSSPVVCIDLPAPHFDIGVIISLRLPASFSCTTPSSLELVSSPRLGVAPQVATHLDLPCCSHGTPPAARVQPDTGPPPHLSALVFRKSHSDRVRITTSGLALSWDHRLPRASSTPIHPVLTPSTTSSLNICAQH